MSEEFPLVFTLGERAVFHAVDPETPAGELPARLALYLGFASNGRRLVWRSPDGERPLDPSRAIGEQVVPEAEIDLGPG